MSIYLSLIIVYKESFEVGNKYRNEYLFSLEKFIKREQSESEKKRSKIDEFELKKTLGYPLFELPPAKIEFEPIFVYEDELNKAYRLQIKILDISFYGMLFEPVKKASDKMVISIHGGLGTPEMTAGIYETHNYNNMTKRYLEKGVTVFAPQMLLWNTENFGGDFNRQNIDNLLKQLGGSIASLELYYIISMINYFSDNGNDVYLSGLSYGGFYALYASAVEPKVKGCLSSCFFNDRFVYNWSDFVWFNSGNKFTDLEVAALISPRKLYIELGRDDEVFKTDYALPYLKKLSALYGENFKYNIFRGGHEFCKDDDGINWLID